MPKESRFGGEAQLKDVGASAAGVPADVQIHGKGGREGLYNGRGRGWKREECERGSDLQCLTNTVAHQLDCDFTLCLR